VFKIEGKEKRNLFQSLISKKPSFFYKHEIFVGVHTEKASTIFLSMRLQGRDGKNILFVKGAFLMRVDLFYISEKGGFCCIQ